MKRIAMLLAIVAGFGLALPTVSVAQEKKMDKKEAAKKMTAEERKAKMAEMKAKREARKKMTTEQKAAKKAERMEKKAAKKKAMEEKKK